MNDQRRQSAALTVFAFLAMFPATLAAPVLREFVRDVYPVGDDGAAWFLSTGMFGSILAAPFAGWISDRLGRRRVLILWGAAINALCWAFIPYTPNFTIALTIRLIEGASSVFIIAPVLTLVSDHESGDSVLFGWVGMCLMLGAAAGLAVGGFVGTRDAFAPFALAALCMFGNLAFAALILRDAPGTRPRPDTTGLDARAVSRFKYFATLPARLRDTLSAAPLLWLPLAFAFADRFCVGYLMSSLNLRMRGELAFSPATSGGILGTTMLLMAVLSPGAAQLAHNQKHSCPVRLARFVAGGSILYGVGIALTGSVVSSAGLLSAAILAGIGAGLMHAPTMILAARLSPPAVRATAMSAFVGLGSLGNLCGPLVSRWLEVWYKNVTADFAFPLLAGSFGAAEIVLAFALLIAMRATGMISQAGYAPNNTTTTNRTPRNLLARDSLSE